MLQILGIALLVIGVALIATRELSAQLHERWNGQFRWTRWATGPKAMHASRIANVVVGAAFACFGVILLLAG